MKTAFIHIVCALFCLTATAQQQKSFKLSVYKDSSNQQGLSQLDVANFKQFTGNVLNLGVEDATFWLYFDSLSGNMDKNHIFLNQTRFASYSVYAKKIKDASFKKIQENKTRAWRGIDVKLPAKGADSNVYLVKIKPIEAFVATVKALKTEELNDYYTRQELFFGVYTGVMLIMLVYNSLIFFVAKDKSYALYCVYILFTWLAQISIQGFGEKYFWKDGWLNEHAVTLFSTIGLLSACFFTLSFLHIRAFSSKLFNIFSSFIGAVIVLCFSIFFVERQITFIAMQLFTIVGVLLALAMSSYLYFNKKFKPAGFYLVAWSILFVGAILFILKDYGILPYNIHTSYLLQLASILEITLLSIALADKINFFKKENDAAQEKALKAAKENERLVSQQNVILEKMVATRTEDLQNANQTLNATLSNLKSAQSQLVEAEKMATLGQLTAGIAHEINNPINFVTSNVKPLELDINDLREIIVKYEQIDLEGNVSQQLLDIEAYKNQIDLKFVNDEISSLLNGISEGAKRTAEIIRSLRNFSRVDETDTKPVDLNEGLNSTLVLIRNNVPDNVTVIKDFGGLPMVDCMPGKINQVFMNLIGNALQAIKAKPNQREEEFLTVTSRYDNGNVRVSIKDSGTGMTEETKQRIFEPFFTTKDIGEGTGLGLSIVFSIIEKHKGHIEVISNLGEGTEFIVTLPASTTN